MELNSVFHAPVDQPRLIQVDLSSSSPSPKTICTTRRGTVAAGCLFHAFLCVEELLEALLATAFAWSISYSPPVSAMEALR